jgi:long-subunit fatty acid transport protein
MTNYPIRSIRLIACGIAVASTFVIGQDHLDAVRPFTGLGGPGGRASGLGQAFTGIADDATALYYNPAGLAHLTRIEVNLGLSHLSVATDVTTSGFSPRSATITATRLNNAGVVLPIPTMKMTVAAGYQQVHAFERQREQLVSAEPLVTERLTEEGRLGTWSLGLGYQVSPKLALGASLHITQGENEYTEWPDFLQISPSYTGIGLNLGILLAPLPVWRIGLLLRSPQGIRVDEEFSDTSVTIWPTYEYKTRSSYSLRLGSALNLGPLLISGDMFWFDYSQIRFESDLYDGTTLIDIPINEALRSEYASTLGYAAGVEFLLPAINAKLRAGYRNDPAINRDTPSKMNQQTIAFGFSAVPVQQVKLDATYSLTTWERDLEQAREETTAGDITVNLVLRF